MSPVFTLCIHFKLNQKHESFPVFNQEKKSSMKPAKALQKYPAAKENEALLSHCFSTVITLILIQTVRVMHLPLHSAQKARSPLRTSSYFLNETHHHHHHHPLSFLSKLSTTQRQHVAKRAVWACLRNEAIVLWLKCQGHFKICKITKKKGSKAFKHT